MKPATPILATYDLSIGYRTGKRKSVVMQDLNLELHGGRLTALLGQNGIGKSTMLRTIAGSQPPLAGIVSLDGHSIEEYSRRDLSLRMSLVFTDRTQAGGLTVRQLVSLGRYPHTGFFGRLGRRDEDVVEKAMEATAIGHKSTAFVAELSDGERQRAMIARALAQETPIIILDEPTAFLDVASRIEVVSLLHTLAREQGKAVLLSTHDISQALSLADQLWIVTHDRKVLQGCTEDLVLSGAMQQMFPEKGTGSVAFDALLGDFESPLPTFQGYSLECENPILRHWITNALRRNGISTYGGGNDTIMATTANDYIVNKQGEKHRYTSVATLIDGLRNL